MSLVANQAPEFSAQAVIDGDIKEIKMYDYKGKWMVLFFYPLDFTFVCPTEILAFEEILDQFKELGTEVLGCSVDSVYTHLAWINTAKDQGGLGGLSFPLLSDLTRDIAAAFDCLTPEGVTTRATYIIDPNGVIRHISQNDLGVGRNAHEVLRLVKAYQFNMKSGDVCPASWNEGDTAIQPTPQGVKDYLANNA